MILNMGVACCGRVPPVDTVCIDGPNLVWLSMDSPPDSARVVALRAACEFMEQAKLREKFGEKRSLPLRDQMLEKLTGHKYEATSDGQYKFKLCMSYRAQGGLVDEEVQRYNQRLTVILRKVCSADDVIPLNDAGEPETYKIVDVALDRDAYNMSNLAKHTYTPPQVDRMLGTRYSTNATTIAVLAAC